MLQVLWAAACTALHGKLLLSEHPAAPRQTKRPSIWRSCIVQLMLTAAAVSLTTMCQWRWGAGTPKPTTLLGINLPKLRQSLERWMVRDASKPASCVMGKSGAEFRTAQMKGYPERFCPGIAQAVVDELCARRGLQVTLLAFCCAPD